MILIYLDRNIVQKLNPEHRNHLAKTAKILRGYSNYFECVYSQEYFNEIKNDEQDVYIDKDINNIKSVVPKGFLAQQKDRDLLLEVDPRFVFENSIHFKKTFSQVLNETEIEFKVSTSESDSSDLLNLIIDFNPLDTLRKTQVPPIPLDSYSFLAERGIIDKQPTTLFDYVAFMDSILGAFKNDNSFLKDIRDEMRGKYPELFALLKNENIAFVDFDSLLVKLFGKTFLQLCKPEESTDNSWVLGAYVLLDLFGYCEDEKGSSLFHDANHLVYAIDCDVLLTDDMRFLKKARFISDYFELKLLILDSKMFELHWRKIFGGPYLDFVNFYTSVSNSIPTLVRLILDSSFAYPVLIMKTHFLGVFNAILILEDRIVLHKQSSSLSRSMRVGEYRTVLARLYSFLGDDDHGKGEPPDDEEILRIREGSNEVRSWYNGQVVSTFEFDFAGLCLVLPIKVEVRD